MDICRSKWDFANWQNDEWLALNFPPESAGTDCVQFITRYRAGELRTPPFKGQPFSINDGVSLNCYIAGLEQLPKVDEKTKFTLCLYALACNNFVKISPPMSRNFMPWSSGSHRVERGEVVSLYTTRGHVGDFMVLDNGNDGPQFRRLMLCNESLEVVRGSHLSVGDQVIVNVACICRYREFKLKGEQLA
ncbi:MAG: cell division protein ZapC [Succinivibrionaceae bacterium]|nr:cell division protein ZapC [Succinivibrionaceae bacterium]